MKPKSSQPYNWLIPIQTHFAELPAGKVEDPKGIESLLAGCWSELAGKQGGMAGYKLDGRTENMEWNPPILRFRIVRHGAAARGSVWGELQEWAVDVDAGTALVGNAGKRLVSEREPRLDVEPLAEEISVTIFERKTDSRLKWYGQNRVRVLVGMIVPKEHFAKQTVAGRRKRFRIAIETKLAKRGWRKVGIHTFEIGSLNRSEI